MSKYLITGGVSLDHLVLVVSAGFSPVKLLFFSFIINKYSGGDTLRLCK